MVYELITGNSKPTYFIVKNEDIRSLLYVEDNIHQIILKGILLTENFWCTYETTEFCSSSLIYNKNKYDASVFKRLIDVNKNDEYSRTRIYQYITNNTDIPEDYINYVLEDFLIL